MSALSSIALVVGAAVAGGVAAKAMAPKPPKPPEAPTMEPVAPEANAAASRQRRRNASAYGRNDTILTSPQGVLGSSSTAGGGKTLLGG